MVIAINATTDANYSAVSNGVDTVTITQDASGPLGNRTNTDSIGFTTVSNFTNGFGGDQRDNSLWWKERAERTQPAIVSSVSSVNSARNTIRDSVENENNFTIAKAVTDASVVYNRSLYRNRRLANPYSDKYDFSKQLGGGVNFSNEKNIHFTYTALHPAGPVNKDDGVFVPLNVLLSHNYDFINLKDSTDPVLPPSKKVKRSALVKHGRDFEEGLGYKNTKTSYSFPFNI